MTTTLIERATYSMVSFSRGTGKGRAVQITNERTGEFIVIEECDWPQFSIDVLYVSVELAR